MRFVLKQRLTTFDRYFVRDEDDNNVFEIKGSLLRIPKKFTVKDANGNEIVTIKNKLWHIMAHYEIETPDGEVIARLNKKFTPFKHKFNVESTEFGTLRLEGNLLAYNYRIFTDDDMLICETSKRFVALRDVYTVDVADPRLAVLAISLAVVFDECLHNKQ